MSHISHNLYQSQNPATLKMSPLIIFLIVNLSTFTWACTSYHGENAGKHLADGMEKSAKELSQSLDMVSRRLANSIDQGVVELAWVCREMAEAVEEIAKSVKIRIDSGDLKNIGDAAARHLKDALIELSKNWDISINTAHLQDFGAEAAKHLSAAIQNIKIRLELHMSMDKEILETIQNTSQLLTNSMDKGVQETANVVRHMTDKITEIVKSVDVRVNTRDLTTVGEGAAGHLKEALIKLSENWKLAVSTADLEKIGAEAAKHASEALKNINIRLSMHWSIDDRVLRAVLYLSIAGGVAFSVLFIAILISLKKCRSCVVSLVGACAGVTCCRKDAECGDEKAGTKKAGKAGTKNEGKEEEMKTFLRKNNFDIVNRQGSHLDRDFLRPKTLMDFEGIANVKEFWENQAN